MRNNSIKVVAAVAILLTACIDQQQDNLEVSSKSSELRIGDPHIFGTSSVIIGGRADIQGTVQSNGRVEIQAGMHGDLTEIDGDVIATVEAFLGEGTLVDGDVQANGWVTKQMTADVIGEIVTPELRLGNGTIVPGKNPLIDPIILDSHDVPYNNDHRTYGQFINNCGQTLVQNPSTNNTYGWLVVHGGCAVVLEAGEYHFQGVNMFPDSQLIINSGPVTINAAEDINFYQGSQVLGITVPDDLNIYSNRHVNIYQEAEFMGNILAPTGTAAIYSMDNPLSGHVHARQVYISPDVTHQTGDVDQPVGTLDRVPVTFYGTSASDAIDIEKDMSRILPTSNIITISACNQHFPPCNYKGWFPNLTLPNNCYDTSGRVLDEHISFVNFVTAVERINEANLGFQLVIVNVTDAQNASTHRYSIDPSLPLGDPRRDPNAPVPPDPCELFLWSDPTNPPAALPCPYQQFLINNNESPPDILVETVTHNPAGIPYTGQNAAIGGTAQWGPDLKPNDPPAPVPPSTEMWNLPSGQGIESTFGVLVLEAGIFDSYIRETARGVFTPENPLHAPSVGLISHELAHLLGFAEQYDRYYPFSDFQGLTGHIGLLDVTDPENQDVGVVSAYSDWLLHNLYNNNQPRPNSPNPWRMHYALTHLDPASLQDHTKYSGSMTFKGYNPRNLRWSSAADTYVDCTTGEVPVYTMQFSEVGAAPEDDAFAQWNITDDSGQMVHHVTRRLNRTEDGRNVVGYLSEWAQWEWNAPLAIPWSAGLPGPSGDPAHITVEALLTDSLSNPKVPDVDDFQKMVVKLYPEDTTDITCTPRILENTNIGPNSKFGASIARNVNAKIIAVGAPDRAVAGKGGAGAVFPFSIDNPSIASSMQHELELNAGPIISQPDMKLGASVATATVAGFDIIVAGAPLWDGPDGVDQGAVFVFTRASNAAVGTLWDVQGLVLPSTGSLAANAHFGQSVSIGTAMYEVSPNVVVPITNLVVGAPGQSAVFAFRIDHPTTITNWTESIITTRPASWELGYAVSLDKNGLVLALGAPGYPGGGLAQVYTYDPATNIWTSFVDLSADSPLPVSGDYADPYYPGPGFSIQKDANDRFGAAVSVEEDLIAVGAPWHDYDEDGDLYCWEAGAVFLFKMGDSELKSPHDFWYLTEKLVATPGTERKAWDQFGSSVSIAQSSNGYIHSRTVVVGAPGHDYQSPNGTVLENAGAAYVFELTKHGNTKVTKKLDANSVGVARQANARFGSAIDAVDNLSPPRTMDHWSETFVGAPNGNFAGGLAWGTTPPRGVVLSAFPGDDPYKLIDGDYGTEWVTSGNGWNEAFVIDLGEEKAASGFRLDRLNDAAYDIEISVKRDGENWQSVYTNTLPPGPIEENFLIAGLTVTPYIRYVRLFVSGCSANCNGDEIAFSELNIDYVLQTTSEY